MPFLVLAKALRDLGGGGRGGTSFRDWAAQQVGSPRGLGSSGEWRSVGGSAGWESGALLSLALQNCPGVKGRAALLSALMRCPVPALLLCCAGA